MYQYYFGFRRFIQDGMSVPEKSLKHQSGFQFKSTRKVEDNRKIGSNI